MDKMRNLISPLNILNRLLTYRLLMTCSLSSLFILGILFTDSVFAQAEVARSNSVFLDFGYPDLETDESPAFNDPNNNNTIDVGEKVQIAFMLRNDGQYIANKVFVKTKIREQIPGLKLPEMVNLGNLAPGKSRFVKLLIEGDSTLASGVAQFTFEIIENDEVAEQISYAVNTADVVQTARVQINSYAFFSDSNRIQIDKPFELRIVIQNLGNAVASDLNFKLDVPNQILIDTDLDTCKISALTPGDVREISFAFTVGINYHEEKIPIDIYVEDKYGQSFVSRTINATLALP